MKLKTGIAFIGIGAIAGLYFGLGLDWIFLAIILGLGILSYTTYKRKSVNWQ